MRSVKTIVISSLVICISLVIEAKGHPGWGIVVDSAGRIYFADADRNKIWRINRQGNLEAIIAGKHSHEITLDKAGNLYGTHLYYVEAGNQWFTSFWKLAPGSSPIDLVSSTTDPPRGMGLLRDTEGNIYSGDYSENQVRVVKMSRDGQISVIAGGEKGHADGPGAQAKFTLIATMVFGADGALYVLDRDCVRRVTLDGVVTTIGAKPLAGIERRQRGQTLLGLTGDARGNVYAADWEFACLRRIKPGNNVDTVLASGWFWSPSGVTSVGNELYVLETVRQSAFALPAALGVGPYIRVRKLTPEGTITTIATVWGAMTMPVAAVLLAMIALAAFWMRRRRRRAKSGAA